MMAYTYEQVIEALKNADAAGDTASAQKLAQIASNLQSEQTKEPQKPVDSYKQTAEDMSFGEQALAGAGGAMYGTYLGAKQLLGQASPQEVEDYKSASGALRDTAGGLTGEIGGNLATFILPAGAATKVATKAAPTWMAAKGLLRPSVGVAGLSSAGGASQAALIPIGEGESRAENMLTGGIVGAVAPAVMGAAMKGTQQISRPIRQLFSSTKPSILKPNGEYELNYNAIKDRAGRTMAEAAGGYGSKEYDAVLANLKNNAGGISRQNAGQAAVPASSTGFSALQRIVDAAKSTPSRILKDEQSAGRSAAMSRISGDDPDLLGKQTSKLDLATSVRDKSANRVWGEAFSGDDMRIEELKRRATNMAGPYRGRDMTIPVDPKVTHLQNNPSVMEAADYIAKNFPEYGNNPLTSLRGLEAIRKALKDNIEKVSSGKEALLKNVDKRLLISAKDKVVDAMVALNPKVADALDDYAKRSLPIDQMTVGRVLHDALSESMVAGEKKAVFENKLKAAASIIKRSTGQDRYKKLSDLYNPEQVGIIKKVLGELSIDSRMDKLAMSGMSEQAKRMGIDEAKIPNILDRSITITNALFNRFTDVNKNRTVNELADIMNDPKLAAEIMDKATKAELRAIKVMLIAQKAAAGSAFLGLREGQQ